LHVFGCRFKFAAHFLTVMTSMSILVRSSTDQCIRIPPLDVRAALPPPDLRRRGSRRRSGSLNAGNVPPIDRVCSEPAPGSRPTSRASARPKEALFSKSTWQTKADLGFQQLTESLDALRLRQKSSGAVRLAKVCRLAKGSRLKIFEDGPEDEDCDEEHVKLRFTFMRFDKDGKGSLSRTQMPEVFESLDLPLGNASSEMEPQARQSLINRAFALADTNGDGRLSFKQFSDFYKRMVSMLEVCRTSKLTENFRHSASLVQKEG